MTTPYTVGEEQWNANFSVSPVTVTSATGTQAVITSSGSFKPAQSGWLLASSNYLRASFTYTQPITDPFKPTGLTLKGVAGVAGELRLSLRMNGVNIYTNWDPANVYNATDGTYLIIVPTCFFNALAENILEVTVTVSSLLLTDAKFNFMDGPATDQLIADSTAVLRTMLINLGNAHASIANKLDEMVSLTTDSLLADIHTDILSRRTDFNSLLTRMKDTVVKLKTFVVSFGNIVVPTLVANVATRADKVALLNQQLTLVTGYLTDATTLKADTKTFTDNMDLLTAKINTKISELDAQYTAELITVRANIKRVQDEMGSLKSKLIAEGVFAGLFLLAGLMMFYPNPYTLVIGMICTIIGAVLLKAFIDDWEKYNSLDSQLTTYKATEADLSAKLAHNKQLVQNLNTVNTDTTSVKQFVSGFGNVWRYFVDQLTEIKLIFVSWTEETDPLFILTIRPYVDKLTPQYNAMGNVLDAYITAFP